MKRCRFDDVGDIFVGENISEMSRASEFFHDDAGIRSGFPHVFTGGGIAVFHHVGQHHNQAVLQFGKGIGLSLHVVVEFGRVLDGFRKGVIQVFQFVPGFDLKRVEGMLVFLQGVLVVILKFAGDEGHGVDGINDIVSGQPQREGQDEDEEAEA